MHDVPPDALCIEDAVDEYNPDERLHQAEEDKRIEPPNEFYDGEKDQDGTPEMQSTIS